MIHESGVLCLAIKILPCFSETNSLQRAASKNYRALGIYFTGAIGAEVAQELVLQVDGHWFVRHFLAHVEEGLEMTGAALLLVTALARLHPPRIMEEAGASEASDARFERRAADLNESSARLPAAAEQHHDAPAEASSSSIAPRRP